MIKRLYNQRNDIGYLPRFKHNAIYERQILKHYSLGTKVLGGWLESIGVGIGLCSDYKYRNSLAIAYRSNWKDINRALNTNKLIDDPNALTSHLSDFVKSLGFVIRHCSWISNTDYCPVAILGNEDSLKLLAIYRKEQPHAINQ